MHAHTRSQRPPPTRFRDHRGVSQAVQTIYLICRSRCSSLFSLSKWLSVNGHIKQHKAHFPPSLFCCANEFYIPFFFLSILPLNISLILSSILVFICPIIYPSLHSPLSVCPGNCFMALLVAVGRMPQVYSCVTGPSSTLRPKPPVL